MKRKFILALFAIAISLATSCNTRNPLDNIDKNLLSNAEKYIDALANYDFESARQYATPETKQITLQYFEGFIMPILDSSYIEKNTPATIRIDSVTFSSDTSATVYYYKKTPIRADNITLEMRQRNGQWLAHQVINPSISIGSNASAQS